MPAGSTAVTSSHLLSYLWEGKGKWLRAQAWLRCLPSVWALYCSQSRLGVEKRRRCDHRTCLHVYENTRVSAGEGGEGRRKRGVDAKRECTYQHQEFDNQPSDNDGYMLSPWRHRWHEEFMIWKGEGCRSSGPGYAARGMVGMSGVGDFVRVRMRVRRWGLFREAVACREVMMWV